MRFLFLVQMLFALGFLLFGLVTLFGIGITGLLFLLPGVVFAGMAGFLFAPSRFAVVLALAADALLALLAVRRLAALVALAAVGRAPLHAPSLLDYAVTGAIVLLASLAGLAVLHDWRTWREAPWV